MSWKGGDFFTIILSSTIASIITFIFCLLLILCLIRKFINIEFTDFPSSPPTVSILIFFGLWKNRWLNETSKFELTFYQTILANTGHVLAGILLKIEDVLQLLQKNGTAIWFIWRKLLVSIILLNQIMTEKFDTYFNCIPENDDIASLRFSD